MNASGIFFIGLMLMSFYFGAGNLIFPPTIGYQAGEYFTSASLGFVITAALLPLLGLIAVAKGGKNGAIDVGARVHPIFGVIFAFTIYLAIGPLFAIPRAINVGYDLGIGYLLGGKTSGTFESAYIIFLIGYVALCLVLALAGNKIVDIIGKVLSPILIVCIVLLVVFAISTLSPVTQPAIPKIADGAFAFGAVEGYGTLDALASYAFGVVVISLVAKKNDTRSQVISKISLAGFIAVSLLGILYFGLSYVGLALADKTELGASGAEILKYATTMLFGEKGKILFATIVLAATITTVVGLFLACGEFFRHYISKIIPGFTLVYSVAALAVISGIIAAVGLSMVIKASLPALFFIYPFVIVLTILTVFDFLIGARPWVYRATVIAVAPFATVSGIDWIFKLIDSKWAFLEQIKEVIAQLPFASIGLEWVTPAIAGLIIGFLLPKGKVHEGDAFDYETN